MPWNAAAEQTEAGEPPSKAVLLLQLQGVVSVEESLIHVDEALEGCFEGRR